MTAVETWEWPLKRLLTEVMGSGPKSAEDMTYEQAREAFQQILDRSADPTTLGAFLLANRWKRNTPTELAGFVDEMRDRSVQTAAPSVAAVDCGANYDGKRDSTVLGVGAGIVSAAAGTPIVVHSSDRLPASHGDTYRDVLGELDIPTDLSPADSAAMVDRIGFGYYYQPQFNPGVHALIDRREAMGVRTFLNTIETLANPAAAGVHLGSFFHLPFALRIINTIRESRRLEFNEVLMVQGLEGYDDLRPGRTRIAEWRGGEIEDWQLETAKYGLDVDRDGLAVENVAVDSAAITEEVLRGKRTDAFADGIVLNAAVRIYAGEEDASMADGVEKARDVIESGAAAEVLSQLRSVDS